MRRWPRWALPLLLLGTGHIARANSALWFDPDLGCGRAEVFNTTGHIEDLPGCSGTLPPKAPEVERVLHELKRGLLDISLLLDAGKTDTLDRQLDVIHLRLTHTPPPNPELPDRWSSAASLYERAVASLQSRRRLVPRLPRLTAAYRAATERAATMTGREREGGPGETLRLARECVAEFAEMRAGGVDLSTEVELVVGRRRRLEEGLAECERARDQAEPLVRAEEQAKVARRAEWRKVLTGDRLKVFDAHPGLLPDPGTPKCDARTCAKASVWSYTSATGNEVFQFRGNKLVTHKFVPYAAGRR